MSGWSERLEPSERVARPRSEPARPIVTAGADTRERRYAVAALSAECTELSTTPEGGRNERLNRAAYSMGQLVGAGLLGEQETCDALTDAADRCGLGARETERTIASGMSAGMRDPRVMPEPRETRSRTANGQHAGPPPADDYEHGDDDAPDAPAERDGGDASVVQQAKPTAWPVLDAAGIFDRLEPVSYLIAPLDLCPGAPALFAGYGFSGKTVAAQELALQVATGGRVWGTFSCRQGRVLHVDYEQGQRLTRERYQRLAAGLMVSPDELTDRLSLVSMPQVYLDGPTMETFLAKALDGYDIAFFDSLRAACPTLEENDSGARVVLDMLNRVSGRTGCTVVVIHHARKPSQDRSGGARMAIRGSGAIYDACGSVLVFEAEKGEPTRVMHEKARTSGVLMDDFLLRIADVEVDGNPRGGLSVTAESVSETSTELESGRALDALKDRIRAYFRDHGDQPSKQSLRERLGVNRDRFYAAMGELEASGEVLNSGTKQRPSLSLREVQS